MFRVVSNIIDKRNLFLWSILVVILVVNGFRFYALDDVPQGFHVDELSTAVTVQCLATEGTDAHKNKNPMFGEVGYGSPKPPTYIYPAALWTKVFGFSQPSFRSLSAFIFDIGLIGLFIIGFQLIDVKFALILTMLASISPWTWCISRLAMEPVFGLMFIVWAIVFLINSKKSLFFAILAGIFVSLAAYSYPPMRLQIPLSIPFVIYFLMREKRMSIFSLFIVGLSCLVTALPLAYKLASGKLMSRFSSIGIFSAKYWESIGEIPTLGAYVKVFINNIFVHFHPKFVFLVGDKNLIYSSNFSGILGWLGIFGILCWVFMCIKRCRDGKLSRTAVINIYSIFSLIIIGIIPSALTWHDIPHSLRMIGAWPFVIGALAYAVWAMTNGKFRKVFIGLFLIISCCYSFFFLANYFKIYGPKKTFWVFNGFTEVQAKMLKTERDWLVFIAEYSAQDYHARYYLMQYGGETCSSSKKKWDIVHRYYKNKKLLEQKQ